MDYMDLAVCCSRKAVKLHHSLTRGTCNFQCIIFNHNVIFCVLSGIAFYWMSLDLIDGRLMNIDTVMVCSHRTSPYLNHCWQSSMTSYVIYQGANEIIQRCTGNVCVQPCAIWVKIAWCSCWFNLWYIQSSAVITRSNLRWYFTRHCDKNSKT